MILSNSFRVGISPKSFWVFFYVTTYFCFFLFPKIFRTLFLVLQNSLHISGFFVPIYSFHKLCFFLICILIWLGSFSPNLSSPFTSTILLGIYCSSSSLMILDSTGASPGFGRGGAKNFFLRFGILHVAKRHEAMRFVRGVRGHGPPRKFLKMVQFGAFGCIFGSDFSL